MINIIEYDEDSFSLVLLEKSVCIGRISVNGNYIVLLEIFAPYRCMGYGSLLLKECEKMLNEKGYHQCVLHAIPDNSLDQQTLNNFYIKNGYNHVLGYRFEKDLTLMI